MGELKKDFEPLMDVKDIVEVFGLSKQSIYQAIDKEGFPSYKIGGRRKFRASEIEKWLKERKG